MAVYRSDQAQLTFASEAKSGGYPELMSAVSDGGGSALLTADTPAGSRTLAVDNGSGADHDITAGEYVQIGPEVSGSNVNDESESRRVEYAEGRSITLDAPTAFFHANNTNIQVIDSIDDTESNKLITWVPGVYETVEVPDPEMAIEGRYLLGTNQKRNFYVAYKGQQTFQGSLGSFVLLNGWPLRFPIGKVTSIAAANSSPLTARTYLSSSVKKGDMYITVNSASNLSQGDVIAIDHDATPVSTDVCEIRRIVGVASTTLRLNYPLQFDHTNTTSSTQIQEIDTAATGIYYQHDIFETVDLDSVSWHVHMRDSAESPLYDFDRRYFGGHVGSMSLAAEEGGMLTASWEGVTFQDMVHNQKLSSVYDTDGQVTDDNDAALPGYALMHSIDSDNIGVPLSSGTWSSAITDFTHGGFPSTDPYYFSQGSLTMFGVEFARVRSVNISVSNNEEARYYIGGQGKGSRRHRGPTEIRDNNREYSMSVTVTLPDSQVAATSTSRTIFKELLLEGDYGTLHSSSSMKGFAITLSFTRGTNDSITITIPDDGTEAVGGGEQGAFIRSASHSITGDNPTQVDLDILFRNMKIQVRDSEPYYP